MDYTKDISTQQGIYLTPQKLNLATTIMANNGIPETAMKVCLLTSYQAIMFRNNPEVKDTDFNIIPALRFDDLGQNGYGDVSGFIKTSMVPTGIKAGGKNQNGGTKDNTEANIANKIEYAYVDDDTFTNANLFFAPQTKPNIGAIMDLALRPAGGSNGLAEMGTIDTDVVICMRLKSALTQVRAADITVKIGIIETDISARNEETEYVKSWNQIPANGANRGTTNGYDLDYQP